MRITFLGSGDAFGNGGRLQTCILLEASAGKYLLDCGATSLTALKRAEVVPNDIEAILITHLHGDHFGGLPFFLLDAQFSRRKRSLVIVGPPGLRERTTQAMEIFFPGSSSTPRKFATEFIELAQPGPSAVGNLEITPFEVVHACGAVPYALRVKLDDKVVVYSGDTEWTEQLVNACDGADVFICEAYFYDKRVRFHLDYATLLQNAARLNCRRTILTHMGPDMLAHVAEAEFEVAHDGLTITL